MRRERQVPFDLDADAVANQRELAEVGLEAPGARAVAAVYGRHRGQCRVGLGWSVFHFVLIDLNYATTLSQSRGFVERSAAGVSEAAGAARARREFIDLDDIGANHWRDDELGDPIAGFNQNWLLTQIHK